MAKHNDDGRAAENLAAQHLTRQGLVVVERNWRARGGELDLVCRDGATLVFVEVRLRANAAYGGALESIGATKRRRLISAAEQYLTQYPAHQCRFDVVLLDGVEGRRIEWIRDAFDAD
ncbi:MAG: YraN family protein [Rhodocyclaceae bacterium]|nr:YraN family protein [Rhodocyclaceae bacterium]MBX3670631.1 YraN family protein [Rhodocyclaceae bacterium]